MVFAKIRMKGAEMQSRIPATSQNSALGLLISSENAFFCKRNEERSHHHCLLAGRYCVDGLDSHKPGLLLVAGGVAEPQE